MKTEIYIATHKKVDILTTISEQHKEYIPIHVGKILSSEDLGFITDDTGENISHLNQNFCELTALYWIWKNSTADILGLVHYRRYFIHQQQIINQKLFDYSQLKNSIIVPYKELFLEKESQIVRSNQEYFLGRKMLSVEQQYFKDHYQEDWEKLRAVIQEIYPNYLQSFDYISKSVYGLSPFNMFIGDAKIIKAYCQWLFDILFKLQKQLDIKNYDNYQKRIYGFLAERLFNIYLHHHNSQIKIIEYPVVLVE